MKKHMLSLNWMILSKHKILTPMKRSKISTYYGVLGHFDTTLSKLCAFYS